MRMNLITSSFELSHLTKISCVIAQIIGLVLDVAFSLGKISDIYNALVVKSQIYNWSTN